MSESHTPALDSASGPGGHSIQDCTDPGREMRAYLTGRGANANYEFPDMTTKVRRNIVPDAPRATWKVSGALRATTNDFEGGNAAAAGQRWRRRFPVR